MEFSTIGPCPRPKESPQKRLPNVINRYIYIYVCLYIYMYVCRLCRPNYITLTKARDSLTQSTFWRIGLNPRTPQHLRSKFPGTILPAGHVTYRTQQLFSLWKSRMGLKKPLGGAQILKISLCNSILKGGW